MSILWPHRACKGGAFMDTDALQIAFFAYPACEGAANRLLISFL
jgi:hypothetical protein